MNNDPLAMPAGQVAAPTFPKLKPDGLLNFVIADSKVGMNKEQSGETWSLVLKTTTDAPDTEGKTLNAGFPVYHYVGLTPTEKRTPQRIAEDVCQILRCAGQPTMSVLDLKANPRAVIDAIVVCKVGIKKADGDFPESNKVTFVEKK